VPLKSGNWAKRSSVAQRQKKRTGETREGAATNRNFVYYRLFSHLVKEGNDALSAVFPRLFPVFRDFSRRKRRDAGLGFAAFFAIILKTRSRFVAPFVSFFSPVFRLPQCPQTL
jgi:hypothetical protein